MWMACLKVSPSHDVVYRDRGTTPNARSCSHAARKGELALEEAKSRSSMLAVMRRCACLECECKPAGGVHVGGGVAIGQKEK